MIVIVFRFIGGHTYASAVILTHPLPFLKKGVPLHVALVCLSVHLSTAELSGSVWERLGTSWARLGVSGRVWEHLGAPGNV